MVIESNTNDLPWIVFKLQKALYALHSLHVREVVPITEVVSFPMAPKHIRGVVNLRGKTLTLLDTRALFGMRSLPEECDGLAAMMAQREQDHRNWLVELEACVREGREFKLSLDPHKCAFGKWYDAYRTDSSGIAMLLMQFDAPHQHIHGIGRQVIDRLAGGDMEGAQELIDRTRDGALAAMIHLFEEFRNSVTELHRELAVILEYQDHTFAITVDGIESAEALAGSLRPAPKLWEDETMPPIEFIAERSKDHNLVMIPSMDALLQSVRGVAERTA